MRYPEFRTSGIPNPMKSVSAAAAATLVTGVSGKRIVVYDIISSGASTLTDGSSTVIHVAAGSTNLTAGISFGDGNSLVLGSNVNNKELKIKQLFGLY